ncbi:hypothetical protein J2X54_004956 [Duganella sp. 3397]|uniref:Uncharacterized protein n=1 Tax=Duganella phyllosphaerae TaxID=762836 RepID=A0A1E7WJF7_9BURK|nr:MULTISPECIES: hypothetical protein [Duganella]MDR7052451.1 hypothetical protein [Duganella sp. 3397]OEZ98866.1 hypothetical protein DUPY_30480 [Duganella phyllosphaerae]
MTTTVFNYHTNVTDFASDVTNAVRKLFIAVFVKKPVAVAEQIAAEESAEETIWWLSSTANEVASHSPSLASELRYAAARA